jgi:Zn-finger nucleic acid-binding protein
VYHENITQREENMLLCPACMVELKIAERQGVEIDYCPQCRGIWLERGELDKILERSRRVIPSRYEDDDDDDDERYRHGGMRPRRRRSFLEDLFDFD